MTLAETNGQTPGGNTDFILMGSKETQRLEENLSLSIEEDV